MTSMNISLKKEAYDFLRSLKSDSKSFSDVILEFKDRRRNIQDFFGVMKDSDWKEKEKAMGKFGASITKRLR